MGAQKISSWWHNKHYIISLQENNEWLFRWIHRLLSQLLLIMVRTEWHDIRMNCLKLPILSIMAISITQSIQSFTYYFLINQSIVFDMNIRTWSIDEFRLIFNFQRYSLIPITFSKIEILIQKNKRHAMTEILFPSFLVSDCLFNITILWDYPVQSSSFMG